MQTITTRHIPATNTKPDRVKATSESGLSVLVSRWNFEDPADAHDAAFCALCRKLGWKGEFVRGATRYGFVYVFANDFKITVY